jgi:hypothetical protein
VDPNDPHIAPTLVPWKEYKNEYFRKRGYTVAGPDWKVRARFAFGVWGREPTAR